MCRFYLPQVHRMSNSYIPVEGRLQGGYVALMATVVIGAILLIITVDVGMLGSATRFTILGTEAKLQSSALARGCADVALAEILRDSTYQGGATTTLSLGTCYVFPMAAHNQVANEVTIKIRGQVRQAVTNVVLVVKMADVHLAPIAKSTPGSTAVSPRIESSSLSEVATLP
jgi:hypothetical protein